MNLSFGIVAFQRPDKLDKLIISIEKWYPDNDVFVIDNGNRRPCNAHLVRYIKAPFDSGAAYCRNRIMEEANTEFVAVLDDDFVFTENTKMTRMLDVLGDCPQVGIVGGRIIENERPGDAIFNIRGTELVDASAHECTTVFGTKYYLCDYVRMFVVVRKVVAETLQWDESLKIGGEHFTYFHQLKKKGRWKVAFTPDTEVLHERLGGDWEYQRHRNRAADEEAIAMRRIRNG